MKNLFFIILIVTLPIIGYFQYLKWTRFNPPSQYEYKSSDSVDVHYFDEAVLISYYKSVYEIGSFARRKWRNEGIDVLFPEEDQKSLEAAAYFTNLKALTERLERKLIYSKQLKDQGYSNSDVQVIVAEGFTAQAFERIKLKQSILNTKFGDINSNVWKIQKQLNSKGYETSLDGNFRLATQVALQKFQSENNLYPSGIFDEETFESLF